MCYRCAHRIKKGMKLAGIIGILVGLQLSAGATTTTDSLRHVIEKSPSDLARIGALFELSKLSDGDARRMYLNQALVLSKKIKDAVWIGDVYEEIGNIFYPHEIDSCDHYFKLSLEAYELAGDEEKIAKGLNNVGIIYWYRNELSVAISYYLRALEINQKIGNRRYYAINCLNIAMLYNQLEDYENALAYVQELDTMNLDALGDGFRHSANNTKGILLYNLKRLDEAKAIHASNVALGEQLQDSVRTGMAWENLGLVYHEMGRSDSAVYCYEQAFKNNPHREDFELAGFYNNLGSAHLSLRNYKASLVFYNKALEFGTRSGYKPWILATYEGLAAVHKATQNYQQAVYFLEQTILMKDSLLAEENQSKINELEAKFESKQKEQEIQLLKKNDELNQVALKNNEMVIAQQKQRQVFFIIGGIVLAILVVVILLALLAKRKSNHLLQRQKEEIEEQHIQLVEKNNEIIDSLNYSKRLQSAILPPLSRFSKYFESHFVYYVPKDIVSGDFYWLEEQEGQLNLAVADCTGHGVPGAIVSVVCANTLSRVLFEERTKNPAAMLDRCREQIKMYFSKNEEKINDGMDISLCSLSMKELKLNWAGANNPLWIIRNGNLLEWKPDKQPIGKHSSETPFTNHEIQLEKGDMLYLFSDGFQDQFGGDKGKKFKASNLKMLLVTIAKRSLDEQRALIDEAFESWRGRLEQVDDVCVIGVRI